MDTTYHSSIHSRAQLHQFLLWTASATFLPAIIYASAPDEFGIILLYLSR